MQKIILFFLAVYTFQFGIAQQNVAINTTGALPHASAQLDISSTNKGALISRMTSIQRKAIVESVPGAQLYGIEWVSR